MALEIRNVGLYDLVLQDVQKIAGKNRLEVKEIEHILIDYPEILESYKQTNVEYNLSNIHLRDIPLDNLKPECMPRARQVNENLSILREIEKYTLDFEQSSVLVLIFSIEFFVLFSVQYLIVLLSLKDWQWEIRCVRTIDTLLMVVRQEREKKIRQRKSEIRKAIRGDSRTDRKPRRRRLHTQGGSLDNGE